MKPEDKELLLKDLCARLPYGVKGYLSGLDIRIEILGVKGNDIFCKPLGHKQEFIRDIRYVKPYLRPMSSMTEEEKLEFSLVPIYAFVHYNEIAKMDWLNEHHFDYRGLINKGLAIEVTDDNNPYKD